MVRVRVQLQDPKEVLRIDGLVEVVESSHHGFGHDCHESSGAGSLADDDHRTVADSDGTGSEVRWVPGRYFADMVERHYACWTS